MTAFPTESARPRPRSLPRTRIARPRPGAGLTAPVPHPSTEAARLRSLIDAQRVINSDLSLSDVLRRIVRTATELAGARYGALGVIGTDGRLEQLVQSDDEATIDPATAVLADPNGDTTSFLGVPITSRGEIVGEIYLAESRTGEFTADDEELVTALAASAGAAITNARLFEESRRSHEWAHASHEITRALLAEADVDLVLEIVSRAFEAADADHGVLGLPDQDGVLRATVVVGTGVERMMGWKFDPQVSKLSAMMTAGTPVLRHSMDGIANPAWVNADNMGPVMSAPLIDAKGVRGSMLLMRKADRAPFTASEVAHLTSFADQVALALDMNDARDDAEWLRVLEVRHQIAKDLHDNVIQRLFATGMGLHSIAAADLPSPLGERLTRYVGELDDTIDEVRERVFGLQEASRDEIRAISRFPRLRAKGCGPKPGPGRPSTSLHR